MPDQPQPDRPQFVTTYDDEQMADAAVTLAIRKEAERQGVKPDRMARFVQLVRDDGTQTDDIAVAVAAVLADHQDFAA